MVHYVFWLFSGGARASWPAKGGGVPKPPSHPATARRTSQLRNEAPAILGCVHICQLGGVVPTVGACCQFNHAHHFEPPH